MSEVYSFPFSIGIVFGSSFKVHLEENEKLVFPVVPVLVLMTNTPLAPCVPQIAVAEASFNTSMDSMSLGEIFKSAPKSSSLAVEKSKSSLMLVG